MACAYGQWKLHAVRLFDINVCLSATKRLPSNWLLFPSDLQSLLALTVHIVIIQVYSTNHYDLDPSQRLALNETSLPVCSFIPVQSGNCTHCEDGFIPLAFMHLEASCKVDLNTRTFIDTPLMVVM